MKKMLALVLSLMMILACVPAMAQGIEALFDGNWIRFEDGFEFYLPADWMQMEVTQDDLASGFFYAACNADQTNQMWVAWSALEAEVTIEEMLEIMRANYPAAEILEAIEGIQLVATVDPANDTLALIGMDAAEPGYYTFIFGPASDETLQAYATVIASSLRNF